MPRSLKGLSTLQYLKSHHRRCEEAQNGVAEVQDCAVTAGESNVPPQPSRIFLPSRCGGGTVRAVQLSWEVQTVMPTTRPTGRFRSMLIGALGAVFGAFLAGPVVAGVYRFPVPFYGNASGVEGIGMAFEAVLVMFIFFGGWLVLPVLGAAVGLFSHTLCSRKNKPVKPLLLILLVLCANFVVAFLMAL